MEINDSPIFVVESCGMGRDIRSFQPVFLSNSGHLQIHLRRMPV